MINCNKLKVFIPFMLIYLFTASTSFSKMSVYYLQLKNTGEKISCRNLILDEDSFKCSRNNALYLYNTSMVENVSYNKSTIYPYDRTIRLTETDLSTKDCDFIKSHIPGPLFLERTPEIYLFIGSMFETGKCTTQNNPKAMHYYQKAGRLGKKRFDILQRKIKAQVQPQHAKVATEYLVTLQKESDLRRIQKVADTQVCEAECRYRLENDAKVEKKFRINLQCFNDCMDTKGY